MERQRIDANQLQEFGRNTRGNRSQVPQSERALCARKVREIRSDEKGRIYTWKDNVLTQTNFRNSDAIPEATFRRFRNLKEPYVLARFEKSDRMKKVVFIHGKTTY